MNKVSAQVITRKVGLTGICVLGLAGVGSFLASQQFLLNQPMLAKVAAPKKPNIILVVTDDLAFSDIVFMPNLKALLVQQGLSFANFFVSNTVCCPSRATILRGQYAHSTKVLTNGAGGATNGGYQRFYSEGLEDSTLATWLQAAGYRTALIGKYLNRYPLPSVPTHVPLGWNDWNATGVAPFFQYKLNENGSIVGYGRRSRDYSADVYTRKAVRFISSSGRQPFFVYLSYAAPHAPATPAPRHAGLFSGAQVPRTEAFTEADVSDKPLYIRQRAPLTVERQRDLDRLYRLRLQSLQAVDVGIKTLVKTLQDQAVLDNTYIFFTSDNGFHLGQHRLLAGKMTPYEEDIHVPLIVRGPRVLRRQVSKRIVGNVDLAPTIATLATATIPTFCEGYSFEPLLRSRPDASVPWRKAYLLEHWNLSSSTTYTKGVDEPLDLDQSSRLPLIIPEYPMHCAQVRRSVTGSGF